MGTEVRGERLGARETGQGEILSNKIHEDS